jgi:hypothetical protein
MIHTVTNARYVPYVQRGLVSLSKLDSHEHELRIHGESMEVLRGDIAIIQGTRYDGLFEMIGTVESASIVILAKTPTWGVIRGDDMTGCSSIVTVETCHMTVSVIAQLSGQRVAECSMLGRLDSLGNLETNGGWH